MKKTHTLFCLIILLLFLMNNISAKRVFLIGDSTVADYNEELYPTQRGWGQMLSYFVNDENIIIENRAINGRSSKSFYQEGAWSKVLDEMQSGDYLFIQFGHNDQSADGIDTGDGERGTAAWGQYTEYLNKYITETRAKGGVPVLFTPVVRAIFSGNQISNKGLHNLSAVEDSLQNYPLAMKSVAKKQNVPLIDLTNITKSIVEELGNPLANTLLYEPNDNTHTNLIGASTFAKAVVSDLYRQDIIESMAIQLPTILSNYNSIDFGDCYTSIPQIKCIKIWGIDLISLQGTLLINTGNGFKISQTIDGYYSESVDIHFENGILPLSSIYVKFDPNTEGQYEGELMISDICNDLKKISLSGNVRNVNIGDEYIIHYPLAQNSDAIVNGPVLSLEQSWSEMYVKNYSTPDNTVSWESELIQGNVQYNTITGDVWPGNETNIASNRYIQFGMRVLPNLSVSLDSINTYIGTLGGGAMGYKIYASKTENFDNLILLADNSSNTANYIQSLSIKPKITINGTETLYFRLFPWYRSSLKAKYLVLKDLKITGKVSSLQGSSIDGSTVNTNVNIYPNPSSGILNIELGENWQKGAEIRIYNSFGNLCYSSILTNANKVIDISNLPAGFYILSVSCSNYKLSRELIKK